MAKNWLFSDPVGLKQTSLIKHRPEGKELTGTVRPFFSPFSVNNRSGILALGRC
jgi:hypothetical protein